MTRKLACNFANLLFLLVFSATVMIAAADFAWAQNSTTGGDDDEEMTAEDCANIPGGNAPINRLARLRTKMAVQNLEFTYFAKPLFELKAEDFDKLKKILPFCEDVPTDIANYKVDKLQELITEAQDARAKSLEWIGLVIEDLKKMEGSPEDIRQLHVYWIEMQNRQFEMTKSDLHYIAEVLDTKRQEIYTHSKTTDYGAGDGGSLVSPFDPGPPQTTN